jgi:parallel beta-helix repeat protein
VHSPRKRRFNRGALLLWIVLAGFLGAACNTVAMVPAAEGTRTAHGANASADPVLVASQADTATRQIAAPEAEDPVVVNPGVCATAMQRPGDQTDQTTPSAAAAEGVTYDADSNTIRLREMAPTTLPAVSMALDQPDLLRETAPGEWVLEANLHIEDDAALLITAPDVRWLKLYSDEDDFIWIKVLGGRLDLTGVCVSSWDPTGPSVDENYKDGRSFVLAREGAHMEIRQSELRYLGYAADESYGLAWRQAGTTGLIIDSHLAHNYYGLYTYEVSDLIIRGNEVHHNVRYGIDPHTGSNRLLIENNIAHHNGKHGIILAESCSASVIRNNQSFHNGLHGIVLYQDSNHNLVENNIVYANGLQGININDAAENMIVDNVVFDNQETGIGIGQDSEENVILDNTVYSNREDGIYLYSDAEKNILRGNIVRDHPRYGIYIKSDDNRIEGGNHVFHNRIGIYLNTDNPPDISREANLIYDNREGNIEQHDG